jgi:hypothetical protein
MTHTRRLWLRACAAVAIGPTLSHRASVAQTQTAPANTANSAEAVALEARVREQIALIRADLAATPTPLLTPINVKVQFMPFVIGVNTFDRGKTFDVFLPTWAQLPPVYREVFERWVKLAGTGMDAQAFFTDTFNWALVAHEVGHVLAAERFKRFGAMSHFVEEELSNRLMVAWCHAQPGQRERLDRIGRTWEALHDKLPTPVPPGAQPKAWFEANYEKVSENPDGYGWFQYRWMAKAWQDRNTLTLADAAAALTIKPS